MAIIKDILWLVQTERNSRGWRDHADLAKDDIAAGAQGILFHERNFTQEEFIEEALEVKAVCDAARVPLFIRDNAVAAFVTGAAGAVVPLAGLPAAQKVLGSHGLAVVALEEEDGVEAALAAGAARVLLAAEKIPGQTAPVVLKGVKIYACLTYEKNS